MRTFYRITANPPTLTDFTSAIARGRPSPRDPEARRLFDGISVFATEGQARRKALDYPILGDHVARIELPDDSSVRIERTTTSRGHHTIWGEPALLLSCVVSVVPV